MEQVDWVPALVMLGIGAAIGVVLIWRFSRGTPAVAPPETIDEVLDLRDERARFDALIAQLRELDDLASERTAEQLASERRDLEIEAARALRELELRAEIPAISAAEVSGGVAGRACGAAAAPPRPASAWRGFAWGIGSIVAVAALVFFVMQATSDRSEGMSPTGGTGMDEPQADGPMIDLAALQREVQQNPGNMAARLDLAQALLIGRDFRGVMEQTEAVLKANPDEPRALSYEAVVRVARGENDRALEMAQRAVGLGSDNVETWVYLAIVHAQRGERDAAATVLEQTMRKFPADAPALQSLLMELRGQAPAAADPAPAQPQIPAGAVLVTVQVDPAAGSRTGTVFLFARPASVASGDPVAVRRSAAQAFPLQIGLLPADSMTGSLPEPMRLEARLDGDGNPATVGPNDLVGVADNVPGGGSTTIVLKRP